MVSHLKQFGNLLLDEFASFDVELLERKRENEARRRLVRMHNALDDLFPININLALERMSLSRRLFLHDMLPGGAIGRYDTDGDSYVVNRQRGFKIEHVNAKELFVPTYDLVRNRIKKEETALNWFLNKEHQSFFSLLEKTDQIVTDVGEMTIAAIGRAFSQIEQHDAVVNSIIVGPAAMAMINSLGLDFYDRDSHGMQRFTPTFRGHLWTADVHCLDHPALVNKSYVLSDVDMVGVFTDRGYMSSLGYHSEDYGMALINPYLVSCIQTA